MEINIEIYEHLIDIVLERLNSLFDYYVLNKFIISPIKLEIEKEFNRNNFNKLYLYILSTYNNKFAIFAELFKIYVFLTQNLYVVLPETLFGLVDIKDKKVVYYYQKRDDINLELFYKQKYLKYKNKYLELKKLPTYNSLYEVNKS